jgi:hypothetical protein
VGWSRLDWNIEGGSGEISGSWQRSSTFTIEGLQRDRVRLPERGATSFVDLPVFAWANLLVTVHPLQQDYAVLLTLALS